MRIQPELISNCFYSSIYLSNQKQNDRSKWHILNLLYMNHSVPVDLWYDPIMESFAITCACFLVFSRVLPHDLSHALSLLLRAHYFSRTRVLVRARALALALVLVHVLNLMHVLLFFLAVHLFFLLDLAKVWDFELGLGPVFSKRGCAAICTIKFVFNNLIKVLSRWTWL